MAVGHEAEVADAMETVGERMKKEAAMNSSGLSFMIFVAPFWRQSFQVKAT